MSHAMRRLCATVFALLSVCLCRCIRGNTPPKNMAREPISNTLSNWFIGWTKADAEKLAEVIYLFHLASNRWPATAEELCEFDGVRTESWNVASLSGLTFVTTNDG